MSTAESLNAPKTLVVTPEDYDRIKIEKMARKAGHVQKEFITTEEVYNKGLLNIKVNFLDTLRNLSLLTPVQLSTLFYQIEQLLQTSNMFLDDLRNALDKEEGDIGTVFLQYIPFFKPYKFYAVNHEKASILLRKLKKRSDFLEFEKEQMPNCNNLDIASLIILPIQRPPRYKLLLQELLKSTSKESPKFKSLEQALEACSNLNRDVNEAINEAERREKVRECSRMIFGKEEHLMAPARELIFKSELSKIDRRGGIKPYTFFLFNDMLIYAEKLSEKKYKMHQEIEVNRMFNFTESDSNAPPNSFVIHNSVKSFIAIAASESDCKKWKQHLTNVIAQAAVSLHSNRPSNMIKPLLVADTDAKDCQICQKVFTTMNRRHHCRFCGKVVCGDCSKERLKIGTLTGASLRACTPCHESAQSHVKYERELKQSDESMFATMQLQKEQMELTKKTIMLLEDMEGNPLMQRPDRIFRHKGELTKVCKNRNIKYRFFLFSDMLCYGVPSGEKTKIHEILPFDGAFSIKDVSENSGYPDNSFSIYSSNKSFVSLANDANEKEIWMSKLLQAKSDRIASLKKSGLGIKVGQASPIYIPDKFESDCQLCGQKFTFTKRKHHCRMCGKIICGQCSKQRIQNWRSSQVSPNETDRKRKDVRICDWCAEQIENQKSLRLVVSMPFFNKSLKKEKYWTRLKAGRKGIGSFFITDNGMDSIFGIYLLVAWPEKGDVCREIPFKIYKSKSGQEVIENIENPDIHAYNWDSFFTLHDLDASFGLKTPPTVL
jgi:hypothetical protein